MNFKMIGRFIGQIITLEAIFMIPALIIAAACGETAAMCGFLITMAATLHWAACCFFSAGVPGVCSVPGKVWFV